MRLAAAALGIAALSACHHLRPPVTLAGDPGSIRALAGGWYGTYLGTDSQRSGSITFTIRVAGDSAFGDVMMEQPPGAGAVAPTDNAAQHRLHAREAQLLAVRFVVIEAGDVEGELEPYTAPDCNCVVRTKFRGYVRADTISGTFITQGRKIGPQTGTWSVIRSLSR